VVDLGEQARRTSPQGDEGDPGGIEPIEAVVGGELEVEDEMLGQRAVLTLPEFDEAEDFFGFLAFADGIGIAERAPSRRTRSGIRSARSGPSS
jgi:hypothetical protein